MKKYIIFSVIMALLLGTLIYLYLPKKEVKEIRVITESHYVLYAQDLTVGVKYFSKTKDVLNVSDILGGFIYNSDESIKFIIEDISIKKIHDERYIDDLYYGYELHFKLPDITDSYFLESMYLKLSIKDHNYEFFVGSLFVEYPKEADMYVNWYGIEGIKDIGPRLSQIIVDIYDTSPIDAIYIGSTQVDYFMGVDNIVINVKPNAYVFMTTFVKISTDLGVTYLPNFTYFMNYELLSSGLHYNYVIQ